MRNIFNSIALALIAFVLVSCGDDNDDDNGNTQIPPTSEYCQKLAKEYNIDINSKKLYIESIVYSYHEDQISFSGRINNKLWVACYEVSSKRQLAEWLDNIPLESKVTIDEGYGNVKTYEVKSYAMGDNPYFRDGVFFFTICAYAKDVFDRQPYVTTLHFVKNNKLIKQYKSQVFNEYVVYELIPWYNNSVVCSSRKYISFAHDPKYKYTVYSHDGNIMYETDEGGWYLSSKFYFEPIDYYEYIGVDRNPSPKSTEMIKCNLKTGDIVWWKSKVPVFWNMKEDTKISGNYQLLKNGNTWSFTYNYTLFSGKKDKVTYDLNIKTGEMSE